MNTTVLNSFPGSAQAECPACGSKDVLSTVHVDEFQYGEKESAATLSASILVHHCESCGLSFTTEESSEARHDAVCRHLGVLTPSEVRAVREHYGLSQADFSELSKIGKASLARWESGLLVQNQANDNLLYLLTFEENVARLKDRIQSRKAESGPPMANSNVIPFHAKFRTIKSSDMDRLQREAEGFELFPDVMAFS